MTRIMTAHRDSPLAARFAVAAIAALLWVAAQGAVSASAASGTGLDSDGSPPVASQSERGPGTNSGTNPGSVRWR